ncbi:MAG: hypothetical protein ACRENP_17335 [Longimicrobiales bacterium]
MRSVTFGRLDSALVNAREGLRLLRLVRSPLEEIRARQVLGTTFLARGRTSDLAAAVAYFDSAAVVHSMLTDQVSGDENRLNLRFGCGDL